MESAVLLVLVIAEAGIIASLLLDSVVAGILNGLGANESGA